ncbi:interleukin-13 receptor subunit alpha-1-like [Menidia menidia]
MMLFPAYPVLWLGFLVLWVSQSESVDSSSYQCTDDIDEFPIAQNSTSQWDDETIEEISTYKCLLYPTGILNCSWSFLSLEEDTKLSVYTSVCKGDTLVQSQRQASAEQVGSISLKLKHEEIHCDTSCPFYTLLHFNTTLDNDWKAYTVALEMQPQMVLSPPQNISASVKEGSLLIEWTIPNEISIPNPGCYDYQLDFGDQEDPKNVMATLVYTEPYANPSQTYRVRIRTRVLKQCYGCDHWSEWSQAVTVEPSCKRLDLLVILFISLGLPMILLALLLLVRSQRFAKVVFPPIPHPPEKYRNFLEKNDPPCFFHPAPTQKPEEEITEVEDGEQNF